MQGLPWVLTTLYSLNKVRDRRTRTDKANRKSSPRLLRDEDATQSPMVVAIMGLFLFSQNTPARTFLAMT